LKTTPSIY